MLGLHKMKIQNSNTLRANKLDSTKTGSHKSLHDSCTNTKPDIFMSPYMCMVCYYTCCTCAVQCEVHALPCFTFVGIFSPLENEAGLLQTNKSTVAMAPALGDPVPVPSTCMSS